MVTIGKSRILDVEGNFIIINGYTFEYRINTHVQLYICRYHGHGGTARGGMGRLISI